MKKLFKKYIKNSYPILLIFVSNSSAIAAHETGNGGGAFECIENEKRTVELLDFWEAESLRSTRIRSNENTVDEQLTDALANLDVPGNSDLSASVDGSSRPPIHKKILRTKV